MAQTRRSTYLIAGSIEQYFEEAGETYLAGSVTDPDDVMTPLQAAAANYRIAQGPRAGQKVLSLQLAPRRPGRSGESSALSPCVRIVVAPIEARTRGRR